MARVKPLAELIEGCIGPAFAAQGFASTDILAAWPEIVGERLARYCQPSKLEWPQAHGGKEAGRPESGTLVVRVEGVFALELQHLAPVVIQRINAHYGWACVGAHRAAAGPGRARRPCAAPRPDRSGRAPSRWQRAVAGHRGRRPARRPRPPRHRGRGHAPGRG